jgi:hypothetical protein
MDLDAFTSRLGVGQARIVAADGTVSFVLGDAAAGRRFDLAAGDHVDVTQTLDVTGVALVRAALHLRVPAGLAPELAWEASLIVDGAPKARASCEAGRSRDILDLAANVSKLTGLHDVGVRLSLTKRV